MEKKPQKYVPNYIDFKCLFQSKISIDTMWTKYIYSIFFKMANYANFSQQSTH